jgi:hypothetical protein
MLKKRRNLPCGDDLLGFFFQLKLHRKPILIFFLISIEKPFDFNLNYIVKPLELNIKTIGFYLKQKKSKKVITTGQISSFF